MPNTYFQFKQFTIHQDRTAMKVTTDTCLFGAWAAEVIRSAKDPGSTLLDIGTGTGLLSLMIAQKNPQLQIESVEIDKDEFEQARQNIETTPFSKNISLSHEDILSLSSAKTYDMIISNPPFYENELRSFNKQKNTAHHDESLTLDKLLSFIQRRLAINGCFYLLLPFKRKKQSEELLKKYELFISHMVLVRPTIEHEPFRMMIAGSLSLSEMLNEADMSVRDAANNYTPAFIRLLNDYYLNI